MKVFPKDPAKRRKWAAKVNRNDWEPTDSSCLCEVHFEEDQWERVRQDGKKKLKHTAVPTIFAFKPAKRKRKLPRPTVKNSSDASPSTKRKVVQHDHSYFSSNDDIVGSYSAVAEVSHRTDPETEVCLNSDSDGVAEVPYRTDPETDVYLHSNTDVVESNGAVVELSYQTIPETGIGFTSDSDVIGSNGAVAELPHQIIPETIVCDSTLAIQKELSIASSISLEQKVTEMQILIEKQAALVRCLKQKIRSAVVKRSREKARPPPVIRFLNDDQIHSMSLKSFKGFHWSKSTIQKSLQLKLACGKAGYEELLKQNYPLPSLRTLRRRIQEMESNSGISDEAGSAEPIQNRVTSTI